MEVVVGISATLAAGLASWWLGYAGVLPVSRRRPFVLAGIAGVVAGLLAVWIPAGGFVAAVFVAGGLVAGWSDLRVHRLPNPITWAMVAGCVVAGVVEAAVSSEWWRLAAAGAGLAIAGVVSLAGALFLSLGWGDVKLALSWGWVLGWQGLAVLWMGAFCAAMAVLVCAVALVVVSRDRHRHVAVGPALVVGAVAGLAASPLITV